MLIVDVAGCLHLEERFIRVACIEHRSPGSTIGLVILFPDEANSRYVKFVNKTIAKIETILKLILTAKDPPAGLVQSYFFLIADKSITNFLKVLELKVHVSSDLTYCRVFANSNKTRSWNYSIRPCLPSPIWSNNLLF